jgi:hypothetical protein
MGDIIIGNKYEFGDHFKATYIQVTVNPNGDNSQEESGKKKVLDKELLARAIENCQEYFWANSAYAVVYCICRDDFKWRVSKTDFETKIEDMQYKRKRSFTCPTGTLANAFNNNPIYNENIDEWETFDPLSRIIKLRDELRKVMKSYI